VQTVRPTLKSIGLYPVEAEKLLMGTAAQESRFRNVAQTGVAPVKGPFQMGTITTRIFGTESAAADVAALPKDRH
jgi:hypothetical protein